jgi:hypothetical protein
MRRINGGDVWAVFGGFALGGYIALCAAAMSGFGHGWGSAMPSAVSIVAYPMAALAWQRRRQSLGIFLAVAALGIAIATDIRIYADTLREGVEYVKKVSPFARLQWGVLFASWQLLALVVVLLWCVRRIFPSSTR